ncbi:hypothetical protein A1F94_002339 [Pyrenophora tritici-repentis]|nr:hypothetical protein A1F94_002339 [Pyrenophora tritici-repentis]KAI0592181.1 hypothetical protein Alg130_00468 [Pyrenophora tritici-repentis]KAI0615301.1 hypothetical protein TUN205_00389 [Pyrenophora tritici-repentis]KAI1541843.1 hypothetical protein PtrSN001A_003678 [Pyrenophora tritici-repentis]KAI1576998.1 hypothetical protein PtrEW4_001836 [Pyrenophora tritici-repentis]
MSFSIRLLLISIVLLFATLISAQSSGAPQTPPPTSSTPPRGNGTTTRPPEVAPTGSSPPDVLLRVPELHVGRIELIVEKLQADLNLNAKVAGLVQINAGVMVAVEKIVERVFDSLDLNPLLISLIGNATNLVGEVIGAVDGLLGSITQNGKTLNFLVDNLGNIVQEVVGAGGDALQSIVGNYKLNMTEVTGSAKQIGQGLTQKTYEYGALGALVNIVTNTAGQVVSAVVDKKNGGGSGSSTTASVSGTGTPMPVTLPISSATSTS